MNDFKIDSKVIFYIIAAMNTLFVICYLLNVKILLIGYICLLVNLFLPGLAILCLLNKYFENNVVTIVLSLGLSIFFLTFACLLANDILPCIGVKKPITVVPLNIFVILLAIFMSIFKKRKKYIYINFKNTLLDYNNSNMIIYIILLILILLLSISGSLILKKTNILIISSFMLLSTIPFLIYFKIIPKNLYPFLVWICALSLVLYNSLFGRFMRPTDNIYEIFTIKEFVLNNNIWEPSAPINVLAMPCVVLLVPYLSFLVGGIVQTYKLVVPLISSFIPVVMYCTFKSRYDDDVAVYSSLFYSFMFSYFTWNSITMKMVTAAINLSLLSLLISKLNKNINLSNKLIILVFTISLIFSHYGTSAIFGIVLILMSLLSIVIEKNNKSIYALWKMLRNYTMFYIVIYYGYTMYITKSSIFDSVVTTIHCTLTGIADLFSPKNYGSELVFSSVPIYLQILKILYILSYVLIIVGIFYELSEKLKDKTIDAYSVISIFFATLLIIPYVFPSQYGSGRIWFISLIFIAPYLILGFKRILCYAKLSNQSKFAFITLFLMIFFVFNSGLIEEVVWKHNVSPSIYISYPRIAKNGTLWEREYLDRVTLSVEDVHSAFWLYRYHTNKKIYCGINAQQNLIFVGFSRGDISKKVGYLPLLIILSKNKRIYKNRYVYLSKFNIRVKMIKIGGYVKPKLVKINKIFNTSNIDIIYSNGYSEIWYY